MTSKYRSRQIVNNVIAFSMAYEDENLLKRGMGIEHLRELLVRLARPILRQGASLAYGGHWKPGETNLMFDLLRLIRAEQEDNSAGGQDSNMQIGALYNHSAWPNYLEVTPRIEAEWIGCCRIVRIDQVRAGIASADVVADADAEGESARVAFNKAVTLSAMRRLMMGNMAVDIPDAPAEEVPPVVARILLGGKTRDFAGFVPGIFEEATVTVRQGRPTFILGGFGGAAEVLAQAILSGGGRAPEMTLAWHRQQSKKLDAMLRESVGFALPPGIASTEGALDDLFKVVQQARHSLSGTLNTGLDDGDTRELLQTRNVATAVRLVRKGLANTNKLPMLPA